MDHNQKPFETWKASRLDGFFMLEHVVSHLWHKVHIAQPEHIGHYFWARGTCDAHLVFERNLGDIRIQERSGIFAKKGTFATAALPKLNIAPRRLHAALTFALYDEQRREEQKREDAQMLSKILRWILTEQEDMHVERKRYVQNELDQFVPGKTGLAMGADLLFRP